MAATKIDHTHALFIHPSDTTGGPIIPIQLIGSENYSIWSRSMRIQLFGKNKLGIVDGTWKKEDFPSDLAHQWDRCDAIVIGWILGSVTKELHAGIVYAENAKMIWEDLKERFDKVNTSRIYQLHKDMVTLSQGTDSVSTYSQN